MGQIGSHLAANAGRYGAQFLLFAVLFSVAVKAIGYRLSEFVPAFVFVYVLSLLIFVLGQWTQASVYGFEPPLVALLLGLVISNAIGLPRRLDAGFRVEFYIKTGIVLLGATLPFTLIVWAGPVAILQASIVSLTTFFVIYAVARRLGLEQRFAATLGVGGAVCGVSAAIAISGAIGTRKEHSSIAIATVIVWAIVMIFLLPFVARLLELPAGIGGAWIGTSEFADAAGLAAAQSYGNIADNLAEHRRDQRAGAVRVHADEGRRPRRVDRHLGVRARDRRDDALGAGHDLTRRGRRPPIRPRKSGSASRNSCSASWSRRCS